MEKPHLEEWRGPKPGVRLWIVYHTKTVYLVTRSDLKTTLFPATVFALASALSGSLLTTNSSPGIRNVLLHLPKSILWTWLNLWIFNLANQRLPNSILEDSINKPWRAIPSGRITSTQARQLLLISIPLVYLSTFLLGGRNESIFLMVLTFLYNDLGAGDENFVFRHILNAFGFTAFGAGATQVACGAPLNTLNTTAYQWLAVIAAVISCTIQFQDMEDQEGDRVRERRTLPIILGDAETRSLNAVAIVAFSLIAPAFWRLDFMGYFLPVLLGLVIAGRGLALKSLEDDKRTFKLWCLWLMTLYLLPLLKDAGALKTLWPFVA